eukprot:TRINITY_DN105798_c0_g1_i1.p1 TRINITY_DN105798_c0_g1~~TRINITY_DN105798_c0_g1_i1.p1  ORF type:complete len:846 (-),score=159.33 TRINITY_DN105798_c0_g1_i1:72-2609(-)
MYLSVCLLLLLGHLPEAAVSDDDSSHLPAHESLGADKRARNTEPVRQIMLRSEEARSGNDRVAVDIDFEADIKASNGEAMKDELMGPQISAREIPGQEAPLHPVGKPGRKHNLVQTLDLDESNTGNASTSDSSALSPAPSQQQSYGESGMVDGSQGLALTSNVVEEARRFAEEVILDERQRLCPAHPARISLTVLAASSEINQDLVISMKVKLTASSDPGASNDLDPNQFSDVIRPGFQVWWHLTQEQKISGPETAALNRLEQELTMIGSSGTLVLPLAACALMNKTFSKACPRTTSAAASSTTTTTSTSIASTSTDTSTSTTSADALTASAGLMQQEKEQKQEELDNSDEAALRKMREIYLSLPGGLGVVVDRELEAYTQGLEKQKKDPSTGVFVQEDTSSYPTTFSWLAQRPHCLDYVHMQGTCGACFMFAAMDSLADRHCIDQTNASTLGHVDHLSIQMALLCEPLGRQCSGGWADVGFNFSVYFGVQAATAWPYERSCLSDAECQFGSQCSTFSSYACSNFFTQADLDQIMTFNDALFVTKAKCENANLIDPDDCKAWAANMFSESPTMVFLPDRCFCDQLFDDFQKFPRAAPSPTSHAVQPTTGSLLEAAAAEGTRSGFFASFWKWLSGLFGGGDSDSSSSTGSTAQRSSGSASDGSGSVAQASATSTTSTTTAQECNRNRCLTEPSPHMATRYHYLFNTKDHFKQELYNDGPFYTSYYVYEDFTWFFEYYPQDGYNYQWGSNQGGHAVVLIGWDGNCRYHGDKLAIPKPNDPVKSGPDGSRRRTRTGQCWHLRNSWGDQWGDGGYFRVEEDMLTGEPGYTIHIASAAGDGPRSKDAQVV